MPSNQVDVGHRVLSIGTLYSHRPIGGGLTALVPDNANQLRPSYTNLSSQTQPSLI